VAVAADREGAAFQEMAAAAVTTTGTKLLCFVEYVITPGNWSFFIYDITAGHENSYSYQQQISCRKSSTSKIDE
jgi:hypothetical protein